MRLSEIIALLAACVAVQAFFAASEIALVATDDAKVGAARERGDRRSVLLESLILRRDRLLALVLTGNNLATVVAAAALTTALEHYDSRYAFLAPFILAPITLLVGESIPKLLALRRPIAFAMFAARPLHLLATLLSPLLAAETALSRFLRRLPAFF
jgi:Mg2+/Co2+ transporter CorB